MNEVTQIFLKIWHLLMLVAFVFFIVAGIMIILFHWIRTASIKDNKTKYDYINKYEIKRLTKAIGSIGLAIVAFVNTTYQYLVESDLEWFFIRFFVAFCIGSLFYYILSLIIKFTYPATLNKKLKKLRYSPRKSPTGGKMKLLSEEDEDVHLDEGMQAEEDVFSVDYDVWVDPKTGYVKIEKYPGYLLAQRCKSCGFQTMKVIKEEIVAHPTESMPGQLIKHSQCSYCKTRKKKMYRVARLTPIDEPYVLPHEMHFKEERSIKVKVEVMTNDGINQQYEFNSIHDARKFMEKMETEKTLEVD